MASSKIQHPRIEGDFILLYGIELEVLLRPRQPQNLDSWVKIAKVVSQNLSQKNIDNYVFEEGDKDFKKWIIDHDGTIKKDPKANQWGLELVSRICQPTTWWSRTLNVVWESLTKDFEVIPSDSCGTHVHVSLLREEGWKGRFDRLKRIAKAVVYFERCIDSLMPAHRVEKNVYCRSNRNNSALRSHKMPAVLKMIDDIQEEPSGPKQLVDLLNPEGKTARRYCKWNFTPLLKANEKIRTIEFRQPPGSTTVADATFWSQFATYFIYGAEHISFVGDKESIDKNLILDPAKTPGLEQLQEMLMNGQKLGGGWGYDPASLKKVFQGKTLLPDATYVEPTPSSEDQARMDAKRALEDAKIDRIDPIADLQFSDDLFS